MFTSLSFYEIGKKKQEITEVAHARTDICNHKSLEKTGKLFYLDSINISVDRLNKQPKENLERRLQRSQSFPSPTIIERILVAEIEEMLHSTRLTKLENEMVNKRRSLSLPELHSKNKNSEDAKQTPNQGNQPNQPNFSLFQSNLLYLFFFLGAFTYLLGDFWFSTTRNGFSFAQFPKVYSILLLVNLILWIDFNRNVLRDDSTENKRFGFLEHLLQNSTDMLFCLILLPFMLVRSGVRSVKSCQYSCKSSFFFRSLVRRSDAIPPDIAVII